VNAALSPLALPSAGSDCAARSGQMLRRWIAAILISAVAMTARAQSGEAPAGSVERGKRA